MSLYQKRIFDMEFSGLAMATSMRHDRALTKHEQKPIAR